MRLFSGSIDSLKGSSLTGNRFVVVVKRLCFIVVAGEVEGVVRAGVTVGVGLVLSTWVVIVEAVGAATACTSDVVVG